MRGDDLQDAVEIARAEAGGDLIAEHLLRSVVVRLGIKLHAAFQEPLLRPAPSSR